MLTVGFDARNDTPAHMAQFAAVQGVKFDNWRLASADTGTMSALLRDLGFSYVAVAGGFDHLTQTTIIDREGKDLSPRLRRRLSSSDVHRAAEGRDLRHRNELLVSRPHRSHQIICTTYDPGAGRYRIDYGLMFGSVIAAFSLLVMGGLLLREWRRAGTLHR